VFIRDSGQTYLNTYVGEFVMTANICVYVYNNELVTFDKHMYIYSLASS